MTYFRRSFPNCHQIWTAAFLRSTVYIAVLVAAADYFSSSISAAGVARRWFPTRSVRQPIVDTRIVYTQTLTNYTSNYVDTEVDWWPSNVAGLDATVVYTVRLLLWPLFPGMLSLNLSTRHWSPTRSVFNRFSAPFVMAAARLITVHGTSSVYRL